MRHISRALIFLLAVPALASAQTFPSKPIRIIATATAEAGSMRAHASSHKTQDSLGQPGIVENRPVGWRRGGDFVAKSVPDGHTLLAISISHAVLPAPIRTCVSPERDLAPVA